MTPAGSSICRNPDAISRYTSPIHNDPSKIVNIVENSKSYTYIYIYVGVCGLRRYGRSGLVMRIGIGRSVHGSSSARWVKGSKPPPPDSAKSRRITCRRYQIAIPRKAAYGCVSHESYWMRNHP